MNLMHSICCLFRGRCASDASGPTKAEQDRRETVEAGQGTPPQRAPLVLRKLPSEPVRY